MHVPSSITQFDASSIETLGAHSISDLAEIRPLLDDFSRIPRRPDPWP
jgi:hypothetical protein